MAAKDQADILKRIFDTAIDDKEFRSKLISDDKSLIIEALNSIGVSPTEKQLAAIMDADWDCLNDIVAPFDNALVTGFS